jgi:hypothetical protein
MTHVISDLAFSQNGQEGSMSEVDGEEVVLLAAFDWQELSCRLACFVVGSGVQVSSGIEIVVGAVLYGFG